MLKTKQFCPLARSHPFLCLSPKRIAMDTTSRMDKEQKVEEMRENCSKQSFDHAPTKHFSDNIMPHILNLYGSRATAHDFEIYSPDASFEDPLMCARGVQQIKSAFYSLSKVFSESSIVEYNVRENALPNGKQEILIDNKQHYKFLGKDIDMISLIKLYVEDGKVVRHEDWWNKKPIGNRETIKLPLAGRLIETIRRGSMLATHAMMGFGKDPTTIQDQCSSAFPLHNPQVRNHIVNDFKSLLSRQENDPV